MKPKKQKDFFLAASMLAVFLLWTLIILFVDTQPIGPQQSSVGLAAVNRFVHDLTGVHMVLYTITDWLSLVPILFAVGFALLGLNQWINRKYLLKVDCDILALGGFYIAVMASYLFFEVYVVNFRPVLIGGQLEASYPSSTTMLVICVMSTAIMQFRSRIQNENLKRYITSVITAFIAFMVIGRLISGVHWFSDIIGGALLSTGLVLLYRAFIRLKVG